MSDTAHEIILEIIPEEDVLRLRAGNHIITRASVADQAPFQAPPRWSLVWETAPNAFC